MSAGDYEKTRRRGVAAFVTETGRDAYWRALDAERRRFLDAETGALRDDLVEDVACAVCDEPPGIAVFVKHEFPYVRCHGCGTVYIARQPTQAALDRFWTTSEVASMWLDVLETPAQLAFDRAKFVRALEELEERRGGPGRLLDIGSSTGTFVEVAAQRGWDAVGVEPGEAARRRAAARGIDVRAGLDDVEGEFDVVTFWEVVEHTKHPREVLALARSRLAPGGVVLSLVGGNAASLANRVMRSASAAFDFARLWYFTPASYARLLASIGLVQERRASVLAELDTMLNYLRYDDPYAPRHAEEEVLPAALLGELERVVLDSDLGYKFTSLATS